MTRHRKYLSIWRTVCDKTTPPSQSHVRERHNVWQRPSRPSPFVTMSHRSMTSALMMRWTSEWIVSPSTKHRVRTRWVAIGHSTRMSSHVFPALGTFHTLHHHWVWVTLQIALVRYTRDAGLSLIRRDQNEMTLLCSALAMSLRYQILHIFPFTSEAKRMGIIVRDTEGGQITFYLKGADVVMKDIVKYNDWLVFTLIQASGCSRLRFWMLQFHELNIGWTRLAGTWQEKVCGLLLLQRQYWRQKLTPNSKPDTK